MAEWTLSGVEDCRKPPGWGRRHRLAILGFCGFALSYAMRFSLSLAIVAMVHHKEDTIEMRHTRIVSVFKQDVCPHDDIPHEIIDSKLNLFHERPIIVIAGTSGSGTTSSRSDNKIPMMMMMMMNVNDTNSHQVMINDGDEINKKIDSLSTSSSSNKSVVVEDNDGEEGLQNNPEQNPIFWMTERNISYPEPHVSETTAVEVKNDSDSSSFSSPAEGEGEFFWSEAEQGLILGSFFWGYILTQIFGGWVSQRIGGKWPFGVGLLITGIFSILTPVAARLGGMNFLMAVRIIQGLAGGVTVPSMQSILSKWFPPQERGKLGSFTLAGMPFGTSMSMLCSGYLIQYFHWPSVFYVTGGLTVLWFIFWSYYAHASPFDDPTIDQAELRYIQASLHKGKTSTTQQGRQERPPETTKVPWCSVLFSLPFWAILICNTCETWGLYTINAELPTYMKTVLRFDIKQNSVMSAFPHLLTLLVSLVLTNIGDNCIEKKYLSIGTVRKLCTSIAMWGYAAALLGVAYSGCDRVKTVSLLAAAIGMNGGKFGGFLVNIIDIAPNYSGILMGIINTASAMPGFLAPWVAGMIINHNPSLENWRLVFLITAGVAFVGNLFYVLFASGEEQSWNRINSSSSKRGGDRDNADGFGYVGGVNNDGFDCDDGIDKEGFRRTSSLNPPSMVETINQVVTSNNQNGKNNKDDAIMNGLYIIPLTRMYSSTENEQRQQQQQIGFPIPSNYGDNHCNHNSLNNYQPYSPPPPLPPLLPLVDSHRSIPNPNFISSNAVQRGEENRYRNGS